MTLPHAVTPCAECPWRRDVPTGKFSAERFIALASTAYDLAGTVFACHMSKEEKEFACAGYLKQSAAHNMRVRMAHLDLSKIKSPFKLFKTYRAMAIANGVPRNHPALRDCRDDGQASLKA